MNKMQKHQDRWVISELQKIPKTSLILDIGAGWSRYKKHCNHLRYESHDFCKAENQTYIEHNYVCDILSIPVPDGTYDAILCTSVLEHVPEPIKAVRECARLLRPSGKIIMFNPLNSGLHQKPYHFYGGFTPFWHERFLGDAGFSDITCRPAGAFFFWYAQQTERAEFFLRKGIDTKFFGRICWLFLGVFLRYVLPALFRSLDKTSDSTNFTRGYYVTAIKNNSKKV